MRSLKGLWIAAAVAASIAGGASAASAGVLSFSDNFNNDTPGLNWVPAPGTGWTVSSGSVDLIGAGTAFRFLPAFDGRYVDLNGSTGQAGALSTTAVFGAANYTLSFDLAGGNRSFDKSSKTTVVSLGNWSTAITLAWNAPLTTYNYSFHSTGGVLTFADQAGGNGNVGNLLDNVSIVDPPPVPESSTWAMMVAGLAGLGFAAFHKGQKTPVGIA